MKIDLLSIWPGIRRFWLSNLFALKAAVLLILQTHEVFGYEYDMQRLVADAVMALIIGIGIAAGIQLIAESSRRKLKYAWLMQLISLPFVALIYLYCGGLSSGSEFPVRMVLMLGAAFFAVTAGYYNVKEEQTYGKYVLTLIINFINTFFLAATAQIGMMILILAANSLLGLEGQEKFFGDVFFLLVFVFSIPYFCYHIPLGNPEKLPSIWEKILHSFLKYILVPLTIALLGILYVYLAGVIYTNFFPHKTTFVRVFTFSPAAFSIIELCWVILVKTIASYYIRQAKAPFLEKALKVWQFFLIPVVALILISGGLRIQQYAITEERYLIMLFGIWGIFALISAFVKIIRSSHVVVVLGIMLILSSFGPWGMIEVSIASQIRRFNGELLTGGFLENGKINLDKINTQATPENIDNMLSIVNYLAEHNASCRIAGMWPASKQAMLCDNGNLRHYFGEDLFGIKSQSSKNADSEYRYYQFPAVQGDQFVETPQVSSSEADVVLLDSYLQQFVNTRLKAPGYEQISIHKKNDILNISRDGTELVSISISDAIDTILKKHNYNLENLRPEDAVWSRDISISDGKILNVKLIFATFGVTKLNDGLSVNSVEMLILLKLR